MSLIRAAVLNVASEAPDASPPPSTFREKWNEIAASQDLKPGSRAFHDWSQQRTQAGHERLHELFFQGRSRLEGFQAVCRRIGIKTTSPPSPPLCTLADCCQALKDNLVNIYDLIDAVETDEDVLVWPVEQWQQFADYTLRPENCYNLGVAKQSYILACFLQKLRPRRRAGSPDLLRGGVYTLRGLPAVCPPPRPRPGSPFLHRRAKAGRGLRALTYQPPTPPRSSMVRQGDVDQCLLEDDNGDNTDAENGAAAAISTQASTNLESDSSDTESDQSQSQSPSSSSADQEDKEPPIETPPPSRVPRSRKRQRSPFAEWLLQAPNPKRTTIWNTPSTQACSSRPTVADATTRAHTQASFSRPTPSARLAQSAAPAVASSLRIVMSLVVDPDEDLAPPPPSAQPF